MNLRTVLTSKSIVLHLNGTNKEEIIRELLDILVQGGSVRSPEKAYESILERERKMSTGMKHGIAIPHGKTDAVSDLVACVGVSDNPVDFESLDGKPCRIFIMTLSPLTQTGPHLQFLAEVSLLFRSAEKRDALLAAGTPEEVMSILSD